MFEVGRLESVDFLRLRFDARAAAVLLAGALLAAGLAVATLAVLAGLAASAAPSATVRELSRRPSL